MKLYKIKKSDIDKKGRGLYATKDIKEDAKLIDYKGKLITKKQTEESVKYDNSKPIYLFTLNKKYDLDGDFSWNTARLINHSCDNNCDYDGKGLKLWVKSIKDIKKGDRLSYKNIWVKRPGTGNFLAKDLTKLIGKVAQRNIKNNIQIKKKDLKS